MKKVELIFPNGIVRKVNESLVEPLTKYFGAVPSTEKSYRTPPELLIPPRKVVVPVLEDIPVKINVPAEFPGDESPVVDEKVVVKRKPRTKK